MTREFMNTVHRDPKSHGAGAAQAAAVNASMERFIVEAKILQERTTAEEQASLSSIWEMTPLCVKIDFMS